MNIEKKVISIIDSTIKDLINGKYKLSEIGEYNSKLEYGRNILEVWIANGADSCRISSSIKGLEFPEFDEGTKKIVYKLATTKTDYTIKKQLKIARKSHRDNFLNYKNSVLLVKTLRVELSSLKKTHDNTSK